MCDKVYNLGERTHNIPLMFKGICNPRPQITLTIYSYYQGKFVIIETKPVAYNDKMGLLVMGN